MPIPKHALFIGAIFFLVTATINVSLLPVHSTTICPSSTTDFFGTFYSRPIGPWNNLDPSSHSVQVFKRILKNKLLDNFVNTPQTSFIFSIFLDYKV